MKILLLAFFTAGLAQAFLYSKTSEGRKIRWNSQSSVNFYVDPGDRNSPKIEAADVMGAVEESVAQWNSSGPLKLRPIFTSNPPPLGAGASLRFSSHPAFFGEGVLAVTSLSYNSASGAIFSADILMNDTGANSSELTASKSDSAGDPEDDYAYVGDVITHEIGHLLGMNHSETNRSSMVFKVFKGQHELHSDDRMGVGDLYSTHGPSGIRGRVVGEGFVPVFGAHVQAIDMESNEVVAGVFSEQDGTFEFKGLPSEKSYALYMTPMRHKESLPAYYKNFKGDFCDGKSFAPSFFSKCGGRSAGRAQVFRPENDRLLDVGDFTVRCATNIAPRYLRQKLGADDRYAILDYLDARATNVSFTGYFTESEILAGATGQGDRLEIDLSGLDVSGHGNAYVKISLSTEKLGTALKTDIYAQRADEASPTIHKSLTDLQDERPQPDISFFKPLSPDSDDNIFTLDIFPVAMNEDEAEAVFGAPEVLTNEKAIYHVSVQAVALGPSGAVPLSAWDDYPYEDNARCLEGSPVETIRAHNPANAVKEIADQEQALSCATVDMGGTSGPGGGMGSFILGLGLICAFFAPRPRFNDFFV